MLAGNNNAHKHHADPVYLIAKPMATDVAIHADWLLRTKKKMNEILAARTGQPIERVQADTERDNFMTAEDALRYGLIDEIIPPRR